MLDLISLYPQKEAYHTATNTVHLLTWLITLSLRPRRSNPSHMTSLGSGANCVWNTPGFHDVTICAHSLADSKDLL